MGNWGLWVVHSLPKHAQGSRGRGSPEQTAAWRWLRPGPHAANYKLRPRLGWAEGQAERKSQRHGTGWRPILESGRVRALSSTARGSRNQGDWLLGNHVRKDSPTTQLASSPASGQKPGPSLGAVFQSGEARGLSQERQPVRVKRELEGECQLEPNGKGGSHY